VSGYKLVVIDVDTLLINNSKRKVFNFDIPWTHWIEGIGSVTGLIFPSGDLPNNGMSNDLVCIYQNDTLLFYNQGSEEIHYDDCVPTFVIDGVSILPNTDVKVYPNPTKGGDVHFENLGFEILELYSLEGKLVFQEKIKGLSSFVLKTSGFSPGVYSYRLKTKGLVPTWGKLIIE
jgi:hypothetical protein